MSRTTIACSICILFPLLASSCIKRTANLSSGSDKEVNGWSAALEAKNARIANLPREDLIGPTGLAGFKLQGADAAKVEVRTIPVEGMPFTKALRFELKEATGQEWAVQAAAPNAAPIEEGDAILATFFLRTEVPQAGGVGETQFVFELGKSPYTKSVAYPVQGGPEWSKIQIRFSSAARYGVGEARMIFRLGYDPQVIQLGGIKVESFGKRLQVGALPATMAIDRRRERELANAITLGPAGAMNDKPGGDLRFEIVPTKVLRTISPYVYGINSQPEDGTNTTVRRAGGNRQTAYNWEIDASNAGKDYAHSSDLWACQALGLSDCGQPAAQYLGFARGNRAANIESVVTVPLVDWVAADREGPVPAADKAPSKRWLRSEPLKPGPFATTPDLTDGVVYQDEMVNYLVTKLGRAKNGGIKFYALDNEPALWPDTHPRVHPERTRYDEMVKRTEATAAAITAVDPSAETVGASMFGWSEFMSLADAPDAKEHNDKYGTYTDYLLASMKALEAKHGRRLLHMLDVHWYPEAKGIRRIIQRDISPKTVTARLQAPRSLWDPTYLEKSWIASQWGKPIRLIPWLLERIEERYPGTKLAITEYNYGVGEHISGGLAQADVLGILGREGVYLATYWGDGPGNGNLPLYIKAAFQLFRNYDGKRGTYGDTAVQATPADQSKASIYAATDSKRPDTLTVLVINKDLQATWNGQLDIRGGGYTKAQVYRMDGSKAEVRAIAPLEIKNDHINYRLPPLSATFFVCTQ